MLNIFGGSADALREKLLEEAARGGRFLVIVPEQYTLLTERELIEGLDAPGFFDLEVLSPSRLTERVFACAGADGRARIDARGKQFALAKALLRCKKELKYYESAAEKQGFLERAGALIADLKRAGLSPAEMAAYADAIEDKPTRDKMSDLALLFAAYTEELSGQFVDGEDVMEAMLARLPESGVFRDARAAVYGFDVLTGQMDRLLLAVCAVCGQTDVLLVMDRQEDFRPVRESAQRLLKEAGEAGLPCRITYLPERARTLPPELAHLRREYLLPGVQAFQGPCPAIRLYAAPNPYFEAHFAAQEILLLHERGLAFGDIAVLLGDEGFSGVLGTVLASYNIPAYVTRKLPVASHGAARFLLASLRAVAGGYRGEDMLALLKSGYAPVSEEEAWHMENYLISYGIRGKLWLSPFARGDAEECAALEEARQRLMEPLEKLRLGLKTAQNAKESLSILYAYLTATELPERLEETRQRLLALSMEAEAMQLGQVWQAVIQLLDQAYAILGEETASGRHLSVWLEAGLNACEISALPPAADAVMCGGIGSLPVGRPRALFLMNLTDGLLSPAAPGLMTEDEQQDAQQKLHIYLSLTGEGRDCLKRLDVWKALSAPTEMLYLTRSVASQDGTAYRPFVGLSHIRRLFPHLVEEGGATQSAAARLPLAPGPALDGMGQRIRENALEKEWREAWKYLCVHDPANAQALRDSFLPEGGPAPLTPEVSQRLFLERVMSVSRLETFAVCPYKHFVDYGLAPQPRKEWTLTPMDAGNFYHSALEGFTRLLPSIPGWPQIDKKTCDTLMDQAAQPLFDQMLSGVMGDSARMRALGEKYRRVLKRVAWTFTKGARQCAFTPEYAEVRFGEAGGIPPIGLALKDGSRVFVKGRIDRIDRYAGDEGVYLRVIDYKSGSKKPEPNRIFWGEQMQLLLYLEAALSMEDGAEPAGAFYMHVSDPLLATDDEKADIEDALARKLQLQGIALKDVQIMRRMDSGTPPLTLPKTIKADGDFEKNAMVATLEDMKALIGHAHTMAARFADKMRVGEIGAAPLCDKNGEGPCGRCDYAAICRRPVSQAPENARLMRNMGLDELLENINKNSTGNFDESHV